MGLASLFVAALIAIAGYTIYRKCMHYRRSAGLPFPPGPKPEPIIGNLRHIPKSSPWLIYTEWAKKFGDVISFEAFGKRIVVLNSAQAAIDLFDKRGSMYSERDQNVMRRLYQEHVKTFSAMDYTEECRVHRKVVNTVLNPSAVRAYYSIQENEVSELLVRLVGSPENWSKHLKRTMGSIILTMTYGHRVTTDDDYLVTLNEEAGKHHRPIQHPTSFIVNFLPILQYLPAWAPGTGYRQFLEREVNYGKALRQIPFDQVKERMTLGTAVPSYTTRLLEEKGSVTGRDDEDEIIKSTAGLMYGAGMETTTAAVRTLILAMVLYPEIQKKVQAEIDNVIGSDRLPTFADQDSLPYLQFCIKEGLRWNPVAALGLPHGTHQDDVYEGMFIPKDSVVIGNQWAILHDERTYSDPFRFWPERWDGRSPTLLDSRSIAFGFNRRLCPGRHLALNSVFIVMANLLATFNITRLKDEKGREVDMGPDPRAGHDVGPSPTFNCCMTPRSEAVVDLIKLRGMAA